MRARTYENNINAPARAMKSAAMKMSTFWNSKGMPTNANAACAPRVIASSGPPPPVRNEMNGTSMLMPMPSRMALRKPSRTSSASCG